MNLRDKLRRWSDKLDHVAQEAGFIQTGKLQDQDIGSRTARRGVYSDPDMAHRTIRMPLGKHVQSEVGDGSSAAAVVPVSGFQEVASDALEAQEGTQSSEGEIQSPGLFSTLLGDAGRQNQSRQAIISVHGEDIKEDQLDSNAA